MCEQRVGSLRGQEERGTARDLGFELILVLVEQEVSFLTMAIQIFVRLLGTYGGCLCHSYFICTLGNDRLMLVT
jgi:hypothetical protein